MLYTVSCIYADDNFTSAAISHNTDMTFFIVELFSFLNTSSIRVQNTEDEPWNMSVPSLVTSPTSIPYGLVL